MPLSNFEFYIYEPKAATNLITNPSFETTTSSWVETGAAASRVATQQRRGAYSLQIAPTALTANSVYYETAALTDATAYAFSVDVKSSGSSLTYTCYFATTANVALTTPTSWTGNGYWQRRANTYTTTAAAAVRLYVTCSSDATSDDLWYIDGAQLETGEESSYLDGDMKGFIVNQADFGWNGAAHASTSWRSAQTRKGGTRMRLKDVLPAITVLGLGLAPVVNQAIPHTLGGAHYQNTISSERTFTIVGELNGSTPGAFLTLRDSLIDAVNYHNTATPQPMVIEWQGLDSSSNEQAETCLIEALYSGGLEGNWEEFGYEKIPLQFQTFLPYVMGDGESASTLAVNTSIADGQLLLKRIDGVWSSLTTAGTTDMWINTMALGADGSIIIGGGFTNIGDADGDYITQYIPATATFDSMTSGTNDIVRALAVAPNGDIYAGGDFTLASGVANTVKIAYWNGTAWNPLSTGLSTGDVRALAFGPDGSLYVGGYFTDQGDANGDYIVKWNGSAWSSLGSGADNAVLALAVGPDGSLYAGGAFHTIGGVAASHVAKWNGTAWSALGTGADQEVYTLAVGPDGSLYVGGVGTYAGGVNTNYIAKWNGTAWSALGSGMDNDVNTLAFDSKGILYAGGDFITAGGVSTLDRVAKWNGSVWRGLSVDLEGYAAHIAAIVPVGDDNLYLGLSMVDLDVVTGAAATAAAVTTVTNNGSCKTYPKIKFTGPGVLYELRNITTRKEMNFNLTLNAGETAVLDLNPNQPTFTSSWRGNLKNTVLPGSNWDFYLQPGANKISLFMGTTTSASDAVITWTTNYHGLDGAVR